MASSGEFSSSEATPSVSGDVSKLKKDLESYRELMLPINKVLEWEQNFYPAILVGVTTFIFAIVWYLEPSVLTTVCLLGVLVCAGDFALPTISSFLFRSGEWTVVQEREYEAICVRIQHAKQHCTDLCSYLTELKKEKPKAYLLVLVGTFAVLAWLGSLIDNLLLTYLLVVGLLLVPGLRKRGILQIVTNKIKALAISLKKSGQEKLNKAKTK